jgi:hypothetical protein
LRAGVERLKADFVARRMDAVRVAGAADASIQHFDAAWADFHDQWQKLRRADVNAAPTAKIEFDHARCALKRIVDAHRT